MVFPCFHAVFTRMQTGRSHNGSFRLCTFSSEQKRERERERERVMVVLMEDKVEEAACFIGVFYREHGNTVSLCRGFWPLCKCPWLRALDIIFYQGHEWPVPVASSRHTSAISFFRLGYLRGVSFFSMSLPLFQLLSLSLTHTHTRASFSPLGSGVANGLPSMNATALSKRLWHRTYRVLKWSPRWSESSRMIVSDESARSSRINLYYIIYRINNIRNVSI